MNRWIKRREKQKEDEKGKREERDSIPGILWGT